MTDDRHTVPFWREEMRDFPHGHGAAAVWVVRREGSDPLAPLAVLFQHGWGPAREEDLAARLPLGPLLKTMNDEREELVAHRADAALWVEPLVNGGTVRGGLAVWFEGPETWRESIFLWAQRLAARLGAVLDALAPMAGVVAAAPQPTLFAVESFEKKAGRGHPAARVAGAVDPWLREIPLPRPGPVPGIPGCVGASREMLELGRRLPSVARSGVNVLLHGESGTGKEIIAAALHAGSGRAKGPFVGQNCAALPESLFESELFGHRSGAFTGASGDKKGLLAAAHGGTFFLDEIGDMPLALQIKLLRVMQERRVRRIGELHSKKVDIRFVAATHKDLEAEIAAGRFRLDLFYRLKVVLLHIPPLRHRPEDVAPLFAWFLKRQGRPVGRMRITERALACLQAWHWPGNVRELENEVHRFGALYGDAEVVRVDHLSPEIQASRGRGVGAQDLGTLRHLTEANEILERYLIRKALAATEGRKAAAARRLGLSRQGLYKKIQRYAMTDLIGGA